MLDKLIRAVFAIILVGLIGLCIWAWVTDPSFNDKLPPWEHCNGGKCVYDR